MPPDEFFLGRIRLMLATGFFTALVLLFGYVLLYECFHFATAGFGTIAVLLFLCGLFGYLVLRGYRSLQDRRAQLILDDEGLLDVRLGTPKIPWADILAAEVERRRMYGAIPMATTVRLQLRDEQERLASMLPEDRKRAENSRDMNFGAFHLDITGLPVGAEKLLTLMNQRRSRAGLPPLSQVTWHGPGA